MHRLANLMVEIPCARCGARPSEWCVTSSGGRATYLHSARTSPVDMAYGEGYMDGSREYAWREVNR